MESCCDERDLYIEEDEEDGYFCVRCYNCGKYPHHTAYSVWDDANAVIETEKSITKNWCAIEGIAP